MPLQFTPGQLRGTVGLTIEKYRHWRRVLPAFVHPRRHGPSFSTGDLLAASIIRHLTDDCGVRVGFLAQASTEIVRLCNATPWAALERTILVIELPQGDCRFLKGELEPPNAGSVIYCPLDPILNDVRNALLRTMGPSDQSHLKFPLADVSPPSSRRRRA